MKKLSLIFICGCGLLFGQQQLNNVGSILFSNNLPSSTTVSAQTIGSTGISSYYYWVIANFPNGSKGSPSSPAYINNAPNTLSISNYVNVSWKPVKGATSYDLLRTTTSILPNSQSNIAVATSIIGTTYHDIGASLTSYAVQTSPIPSTCLSYYDVVDYSSPQLVIPCLAASGGTVTSVGLDLSTLGFTVSGSPVTSSGTLIASGGILNIANGGTGTATPSLVNGTNTTVSGTWPNQAVNITSIPYTSVTGATNRAIIFGGTPGLTQDTTFTYNSSSGDLNISSTAPNPGIFVTANQTGNGWGGYQVSGYAVNGGFAGNAYSGYLFIYNGNLGNNNAMIAAGPNYNVYLGGDIKVGFNNDPSATAGLQIWASENNHIYSHGTMPTLTGCPAGSTISGNDHIGNITISGAASSGCDLVFATPYTVTSVTRDSIPNATCVVVSNFANTLTSYGMTNDGSTHITGFNIVTSTGSDIQYMCGGWK